MVTLALLAAGTLCAADIFWGGGHVDIPNETPLPATAAGMFGNWDATTKNWANTPSGSVYSAYSDGTMLWLGAYPTAGIQVYITNSVNATLTGLACSPAASANNYLNIYANAATPTVLTPAGDRVVVNVVTPEANAGLNLRRYVSLEGVAPLHKTGAGQFQLAGINNSYTGPISIDMGTFNLVSADSSSPSLNGVTSVTVMQRVNDAQTTSLSGNQVAVGNFSVSAGGAGDNKLNDNLVVTMKRGQFTYNQTATSTETIGKIVLSPWGLLSGNNYGTIGGVLTLSDATAGISRGSDGQGTACFSVPAGGEPRVSIRISNGIATDTLLPWFITTRAEFMQVVSANNNALTQIVATAAATDLGTWDTTYDNTSNVRVGNGTAVALTGHIDANTTVKSLAFNNTSATTLTNAEGVTLTIAAGAIAFAPGASADQTISGGSLASGTSELYLNCNDSTANGGLRIWSPIVGTLDLIKSGTATVSFRGAGANTYSGTTYVNNGNMELNKAANVVSIPGNLVIKRSDSVQLASNNQINQNADVTIHDGALLALTTGDQTHNGQVTINGGTYYLNNRIVTMTKSGAGLAFNGGWFVHNSSSPGTLNLQTDVSYASGSSSQARWELYNTSALSIELDGGNRTFYITNSATLPAGTPEMVIDVPIVPGSPAGGSITKTGAGVLQLTGRNTYTGGTTIDGGTLLVAAIQAPAQSNLTAYTQYSSNINRPLVFTAPVAKNMVLGQTITGDNIPAGRSIRRVIDDYQVLLSGAALAGGTQSMNIVVGPVLRYGTLGTGAVTVNDTGTLQVDAPCNITNFVAVNDGGTLDLNGTLVGAVVNAGTLKGNGTMTTLTNAAGGVLAPGASVGVMTISGSVALQQDSEWELEWNDGVTNDIVVVGGNFAAAGSPVIKVLNVGGAPAASTQVVLKVTGTYTGPVGGYQFDLPPFWSAITDGSGDLIDLGGGEYGIAFLPEPGAVMMALLAVLGVRRR